MFRHHKPAVLRALTLVLLAASVLPASALARGHKHKVKHHKVSWRAPNIKTPIHPYSRRAHVALAAGDPPTIVSLTFDDGDADTLAALPLLQSHGMHATFFINSALIGGSGKMTWSDVHNLASQGNEVAGHTLTHVDLTTLSTADATTQVCQDRQNIINQGFSPTDFAYPFGAVNSSVENIVRGCGYASARTIGNLVNPNSCQSCNYANSVPPTDPYNVATNDSIKNTTSLATIEGYVTNAETHGGGWVPLVMHHVGTATGNDPYQIDPSTLSALLSWLQTQPVQVETVAQVMNAPPPPPPPPPPSPGANLVQNASMSQTVGGKPVCYQFGQGGGTNTTTWSQITKSDGSLAEQGVETSRTSGGAILVTAQDGGTCAPAATPGKQYLASISYTADHPVYLEVYYHNSTGWHWWTEKSSAAATGTTQVSLTTPAVPAGADLLSIGLEMPSVGTFTMNNYSLAATS